MNVSDFQTSIQNIFSQMNNMTSGGDKYFADNLASAIKTLIASGKVTSNDDAGSIGTSTYKGKGTGSMSIDDTPLATNLLSTFTKEDTTDDEIADGIADNVNTACSVSNSVSTTTRGTQTFPNGATSEYEGSGKGTFSGTKKTISDALKTAFNTMSEMTSGGNDVFAAALASSISSYLTGGSIDITLQTPISGSATGKIA